MPSMNQTLLIIFVALGSAVLVGLAIVGLYKLFNKRDRDRAYKEVLDDITVYDDEGEKIQLEETYADRWNKYWANRFKVVNNAKYVTNHSAAGKEAAGIAIITAVLLILLLRNPLLSIFGAALILYILSIVLKSIADREQLKLDKQLPGFLAALKANVQAGETPEKAILEVTDTMPSPLREELSIAKQSIQASNKFSDAMEELKAQTKSNNLAFLCSCIIQASNTGTSLEKQIGVIEEILESRREIHASISEKVSSVTPTIWVASIVIPGIFLMTLAMNEQARLYWFVDPTSWIMLIIVILLYLFGVWMTKKLVDGVRNL